MRYREHFKELIKKDSDGTRESDGKIAFEDVKLVKTLLGRQERFASAYLNLTLSDGIRWIVGYSNFINQSLLKERSNLNLRHTYSKGSIIYVDFFGHFGHEIAFDHPAIVLGEVGYDLIVAPITSNKSIYEDEDSEYYHVKLEKDIAKLGNMRLNSTIKLEQVRFISKKRILVNFKKRVSDNEKLEEIDIALMKVLASHTFDKREKRYEDLVKVVEHAECVVEQLLGYAGELVEEVDELVEENKILLEEIETLKKQQVG